MRDNKERRLIIDLKGIKKRFFEGTENEIEVLKGIDLQVNEGEFVSIVGASGSGKSTLMNIIGALDRASEGSYLLDGVDINQADDNELSHIRNKKIGFVFQTYNLIPRISALKNVERPMLYAKVPGDERTERAKELLKLVGMEDNPDELSGGQQQRVAIARAMANLPAILLADEPTGALDSKTGRLIMDIFHQLNREQGMTVIWITHFMEEAAVADRVVVLDKGKIALDGTPAEVFSQVQKVKALGLDVPPMAELAMRLRAGGLVLPDGILTVADMVKELKKALCPSK